MRLVLDQVLLICQTRISFGLEKIGPLWANEPLKLSEQWRALLRQYTPKLTRKFQSFLKSFLVKIQLLAHARFSLFGSSLKEHLYAREPIEHPFLNHRLSLKP